MRWKFRNNKYVKTFFFATVPRNMAVISEKRQWQSNVSRKEKVRIDESQMTQFDPLLHWEDHQVGLFLVHTTIYKPDIYVQKRYETNSQHPGGVEDAIPGLPGRGADPHPHHGQQSHPH